MSTDAEAKDKRIAELERALRIAMGQWAEWIDEARGITPNQMFDAEVWGECQTILWGNK